MRFKVSPPGNANPFDEWSTAIVARARRPFPTFALSARGSRLIIIRYGGSEARLSMDGSSSAYWITFASRTTATP
jgi:hypothetical protein